MIKQDTIENFKQSLEDMLKNSPFKDIDKNLKAIVLAAFSKLDLVTRDEFDVQKKMLANTYKKLEELENIVKEISNKGNTVN